MHPLLPIKYFKILLALCGKGTVFTVPTTYMTLGHPRSPIFYLHPLPRFVRAHLLDKTQEALRRCSHGDFWPIWALL